MSELPNDPLLGINIEQLVHNIKNKKISCEKVPEFNLKRIKLLPYYWKVKLEVENKNKINK